MSPSWSEYTRVFIIIATAVFALVLSLWKFSKSQHAPAGPVALIEVVGGHGSGVHIGRGLILTAAHVVKDQKEIKVRARLYGGDNYTATVLWASAEYDVALIEAPAVDGLMAVSDLTCRAPEVGEKITLAGNPRHLRWINTDGRVAGDVIQIADWRAAVPMDATALPGMSGGPVYDENGDVLGLITGVLLDAVHGPMMFPLASTTGIGIMVPSSAICRLLARG